MKFVEKFSESTVQKTNTSMAGALCARPTPVRTPSATHRPLIMKYFSLLLLLVSFLAHADKALDVSTTLAPSHAQQITTLEVVRKLQIQHFEKHTIDDTFSLSFLDNYLRALDANRQIFEQADINALYKKYGATLDDTIKRGNVQPGFEIFNLYRSKHIALLEKTLADLPATVRAFDYKKEERIQTDRSEAAWPKNSKEIDHLWYERLKASALSLKLADKKTDDIIDLLSKRYKNQLDRLKKVRSDDVYQLYMNAFTELYDPHTNYLSPASSENFDISMSLKLEGIGAILSASDEHTQVVRLIHAGPAQKQGELQPMDKIVAVGQGKEKMVDVVGWRLDEVVNLIRGPKGSTVRLEVIPAKAIANDEHKTITIVRDEVKLEEQSVQKAMLNLKDENGVSHKIGILNVPTFYIDFDAVRKRDPNYKSTTRDAAKLLSELVQEGAEGIIVDLRDNGGGSLREANELTGLFIEKGPSVQIRQADNRTYVQAKNFFAPYYDGPMVVLINRMSASASEIFAGAMQDYQRAIVVGSPSFGKGTVQSLTDLSHGKLKLTESKFYRISGKSTQSEGVTPDIALPSLYDESKIGESFLDKALANDSIAPADYRAYYNLKPIIESLSTLSKKRAANDADFIYIKKRTEYDKNRATDYVSLNEQVRLRERETAKKELLKLLNEKRQAKGLDALTSLTDADNKDKESDEDKATLASDADINKIDLDDPYLNESARILLDMEQSLNQQLAKAK